MPTNENETIVMKSKREKRSVQQVLAWLQENHPGLWYDAELDREWVWLTSNLSGEENKGIRESIKLYGFRFAKNGHALPSGKQGTWAHASMKPLPGKIRGGAKRSEQPKETEDVSDEELLAALIG